ncbi:hypothetical protein [Sphingobacterium tabacisoli]|uniref:DUF5018 domain-containing protein n=1 Tax=Sphingobacterium tabacisoli TaxID=2044855 RepID=A0ABW5L6Y6_9SPHI|nr:hypothetical protein [Sphingobacterium tabacisoli]
MRQYIKQFVLTVLTLSVVYISSCTKTEYEQIKLPYNEITKFAIKSFTEGDSIQAVISGDELLIYWDKAVAIPESITPTIAVSKGASVSPASGQPVTVTESLSFTVTAEDATIKTYKLRFILQTPNPIILAANNATWLQWFSGSPQVVINGQYFLAGGDPNAVRVFARRASDGFEFDLTTTTIKSTVIGAKLPDYTTAMDTGRHDIKLNIGTKTINVAQGYIRPHPLFNTHFKQEAPIAKTIKVGDEIRFLMDDGELAGRAIKYYAGKCSKITFYHVNNGEYKLITVSEFKQEGNTISFKLPALTSSAGDYVDYITFTYPSYNILNDKTGKQDIAITYTAANRIYIN